MAKEIFYLNSEKAKLYHSADTGSKVRCELLWGDRIEVDGTDMAPIVKAKVRGWTVEQVYDEYVQEMALKRVTTPQDVANAVLFMASDDARNITGQELAVDGGWDV